MIHPKYRSSRSAERGERVGLRIAVNADRQGDGVRLGIAAEVRQALAGGLAGRNGRGLGFAVIQIRPLGLDGGAFRGRSRRERQAGIIEIIKSVNQSKKKTS